MKKLYLTLSLCLIPCFAFSWGLMDSFVKKQKEPAYKNFIVYKLLKGKKEFTACFESYEDTMVKEMLFNMQKALNSVLDNVLITIQKSGRTQEFKDILAVLPQNITIMQVKHQQECRSSDGIDFIVKSKNTRIPVDTGAGIFYGEQGFAYWKEGGKYWLISLSSDETDYTKYAITQHEVSHLFGLADQYKEYGNSKMYSLVNFEDITKINTVMSSVKHDKSWGLTCDDAEGVINAMDFILRAENYKSARLKNGWGDLCGRSYVYIDGQPVRDTDLSIAAHNRDLFAGWTASGYPKEKTPDFVKKASDKHAEISRGMQNVILNRDKWEEKRNNIETEIGRLQFELDHAKDYRLTPAQKRTKQQKIQSLKKELETAEGNFKILNDLKATSAPITDSELQNILK